MNDTYILDSCALIALISKEKGDDYVSELLKKAVLNKVSIIMHKINLLEVYYHFYKKLGKTEATAILNFVYSLPIDIISDITENTFLKAGRLKSLYKMSIADTIGIAESIINNGYFVTADHHELDKIPENERIKFAWIR
ncbi:MAG: PIN domain-containing protein [Candidatus Cloacimonetes bacterium]|nr:PIN domain-containing protein [Candidatus Cloacimonadota bacterium]